MFTNCVYCGTAVAITDTICIKCEQDENELWGHRTTVPLTKTKVDYMTEDKLKELTQKCIDSTNTYNFAADKTRCTGCGIHYHGNPCDSCKGLATVINTIENNSNSSTISVKVYNELQNAYNCVEKKAEVDHKQIADLKAAFTELEEWASEKYIRVVDRYGRARKDTKKAVILYTKKQIYAEVLEHCTAALEDNE